MTTGNQEPVPYLGAAAVFAAVLLGYAITLAPTVTFWDAGELIAASRTLGIPHPPGTPLFVMLAHAWALLVPVGEYAVRTNLLSASFSAAGAAFWFLSAHTALEPVTGELDPSRARLLRLGGGAAAALASAFTFTHWQNSNETEVYSVAIFTIAAVVWLALRWRALRGTERADRALLLAVYLGGLSIGNHLLALLAGPALVGFLLSEVLGRRAERAETVRRELTQVAVVAGTWTLLIGIGLGNTVLVTVGGLAVGLSAGLAWRAGAGRFAILALLLAAVGVTVYLFLYFRAGQGPMINEADPSTWERLLAVIRREQYPPRTPLDDPTQLSGPGNPGRSLSLIGLQLLNYIQYFDWQWARALGGGESFPLRTLGTLGFASIGLRGFLVQRRTDRSAWWLFTLVFLATGLGLVAYMNFKPGFSIGYDLYPSSGDHEVRERDYFFVASFIVWGVWAGLGLADLARHALSRGRAWLAPMVLGLALLPFALNFGPASRRHNPAATLARDFAYDLLNSVPPYGVLFTYGDNDTFPLWWAQEVEGIRQDVTVVCLALAETPWYMTQLRDMPVRPFDPATAPEYWRRVAAVPPEGPLHTMSDAEIQAIVPQALGADLTLRYGSHQVTLPRGTVLSGRDVVSIRLIQQTIGRRPIAWSITAAGSFYGLDHLLVQEGMALRIADQPPDEGDPRFDFRRMLSAPLDLAVTDSLLFGVYRYGALLERGHAGLESTALSMSATLGLPFTQMAFAFDVRGDLAATVRYLERAVQLSPNPALRTALEQARARAPATEP